MRCAFILLLFLSSNLFPKITLPENYHSIVEELIYFKDNNFKIYYGGPVENGAGVKWLMPVAFKDAVHQIRAVYEISFINCLPEVKDTEAVEVLYIKVSDIDIKFKNISSENYLGFCGIVNNDNPNKKYVLIREVDVSNICYPEIFISAVYSDFKHSDLDSILSFLRSKLKTKAALTYLTPWSESTSKNLGRDFEGLVEKKQVQIMMHGNAIAFDIDHYYIGDDPWKSYYVVSCNNEKHHSSSTKESVCLRLDSGCTSGQVYNDSTCDCLDQLHDALFKLAKSENEQSLLIHIPGHDGRGFGVAPKSETEIYKRGGCGRIHCTESLNTVDAAKLLYHTESFDIRTYDGCAKILKMRNIDNVNLLTDNKTKVQALVNHGISVNRLKTDSKKLSCLSHILAKKESSQYFKD